MQHYYALIMAGGGGTRLWPMSRRSTPKQLLALVEEKSMFCVSVERLAPLFPPENVYVVAGEGYVSALQAEAPEIPAQNFIAEPYGRDSGPAAALGLSVIHARDPQATVVILTADHHISDKQRFRDVLAAAGELAERGFIVTLGISPAFPATGFGYIRRGEKLDAIGGFQTYRSLGFTEKPSAERALEFLISGEYSWNSGMFIWKAAQGLAEFARQQPVLYAELEKLRPAIDTPAYSARLLEVWERIPKISIDYAVMEGAQNMAVIPVDIGWSDVGSWDSLYGVLQLDDAGNGFKGSSPRRVTVDTKNSLIYSDRLTVTIGVENLVVVDTDDVLMICHKDRTQDVRQVVNALRDEKFDHVL